MNKKEISFHRVNNPSIFNHELHLECRLMNCIVLYHGKVYRCYYSPGDQMCDAYEEDQYNERSQGETQMKTGAKPSEILPVFYVLRDRMYLLQDEISVRKKEFDALVKVTDELLERLHAEGIRP